MVAGVFTPFENLPARGRSQRPRVGSEAGFVRRLDGPRVQHRAPSHRNDYRGSEPRRRLTRGRADAYWNPVPGMRLPWAATAARAMGRSPQSVAW